MKYVLVTIVLIWVLLIRSCVVTTKNYTNEVGVHWYSTLITPTVEEKARAIDNYVAAVDSLHLEGKTAALFVVSEADTYEYNRGVIADLQSRIKEIAAMPDSSVERALNYKQLTDQLSSGGFWPPAEIQSIYTKTHAYWIWFPIGVTIGLITALAAIVICLVGLDRY